MLDALNWTLIHPWPAILIGLFIIATAAVVRRD